LYFKKQKILSIRIRNTIKQKLRQPWKYNNDDKRIIK
jgi:hypothetical protein